MIGYIGGKHRLAPTLIAKFPPHITYVEPFSGMAHVLMRKPESKVEVLNDLNDDVVTFLRVCQFHHGELLRYLRYAVASRRLFEICQGQNTRTLTDVQRAARFLYLQRAGFGGRVVGRSFGTGITSRPRFNPESLPRIIECIASRLEHVLLECQPYEQVLDRFDRNTTLFYCDPPYIGTRSYGFDFRDQDYADLAQRLALVKGKFLLSINDHPLARTVFGRFHCDKVTAHYSVGQKDGVQGPVNELVFANYDLHQRADAGRNAVTEV